MNLLMLATLAVCMAACGGKGSGDGSSEKKDAITLKTEVQKIGDFAKLFCLILNLMERLPT